ncbi:lipopolysaccharide biosynthesis protein [Xanthobacter dioxanivorans]|nr:oligosaccharide flippase family protein [Xanthobacter dioxanivorans]
MSDTLPRSLASLINTYGGYVAAMMARGLELVGKLGLYIVSARILGVHESGYFFLCLTWIGVLATVSRGGFERAVVRHVAAELAVGKGRAAGHAFLAGALAVLMLGLVVSIATGALSAPIATYLFRDPEAARPLFLAAFVILPQALCYFVGNALMGLHKSAWGQLVQNGLWPLFTLAALFAGVHSLDGILCALAAANAAATAIGAALVFRERHRFVDAPSETANAERLPALWRTAMPLAVVETVQILLPALPVLLLASFGLPAQVGAFSVASRISMLTWVVSASIGSVAAPSFAARHRQGRWDELRQLNRKVRLAVALFSAPLLAGMFFFPATLLHLVGPGFEIASTALVILAVGQLVYALLPCQEIVLAMAGHGGILRWLTVAQTVVCLVLCVLLIPPFGMIGAAIATAVFAAQLAIGSAVAVRRLMPRAF